MALLLDLAPRGFFGPKRLRPSTAAIMKALPRMNMETTFVIAQPSSIRKNPFPEFNPHPHVNLVFLGKGHKISWENQKTR